MKIQQRGYSLPELLIVVAIVGLISLVGVPAFIKYFQSMRINSSLREFTSELRGARQRAVARNRPVKFSFTTGAPARQYAMFDGSVDLATWTPTVTGRELEENVYFHDATFEDGDTTPDGMADIVFRPNGSIAALDDTDAIAMPTENEGGQLVTKIIMRTNADIPFNQYTIYFDASGRVTTTRSRF